MTTPCASLGPVRPLLLALLLAAPAATLLADDKAPAPEAKAKEAAGPAFCRFEPKELARVEFKPKALRAPCKIERVTGKDGPVTAGDALLQLKAEDAEAAQTSARLASEQARLALRNAENEAELAAKQAALTTAEGQAAAARARLALTQFAEIDKPTGLTEAKARLDSQLAELEDAKTELAQLEKMYEGSKVEGETRKLVLARANRRLEMASVMAGISKIRFKQSVEVSIPQQENDLRMASNKAALAEIRSANAAAAQVAQAKLALESARQALGQAEQAQAKLAADLTGLAVTAPATGTLVGLDAKEGADAAPGVLARVVDLRHGAIHCEIPADKAADYAPGTKVALEIPELKLKLEGQVTRLSVAGHPAGNATTRTADIELAADRDLAPGMAVRIVVPAPAQDKH